MDGDEWTESPSLSGFHRFVDQLRLVRKRLAHEHLPNFPVFLQHRVEERAQDGRP